MSRKRKTAHANYVEIIEVMASEYREYIMKKDYEFCDKNSYSDYYNLSRLKFKKGQKVRVQWPKVGVTKEEIAFAYFEEGNNILGFKMKVNGLETTVIANLKKLRFNEEDLVVNSGLTPEQRLARIERSQKDDSNRSRRTSDYLETRQDRFYAYDQSEITRKQGLLK